MALDRAASALQPGEIRHRLGGMRERRQFRKDGHCLALKRRAPGEIARQRRRKGFCTL